MQNGLGSLVPSGQFQKIEEYPRSSHGAISGLSKWACLNMREPVGLVTDFFGVVFGDSHQNKN